MQHDYMELLWAESADIAEFVSGLTEDQWATASLCEGWNHKAVVSHMVLGHSLPMPKMLATVARHGFSIDKTSRLISAQYASEHSGAEIAKSWSEVVDQRRRHGASRFVPVHAGFADHLVHHQDIRRPLGLPRSIAESRLVAALDAVPKLSGPVPGKKRIAGLRLVATDVDWRHGDGPEVAGPGETLVMAASGRRSALAELSGDGVSTLTARLN